MKKSQNRKPQKKLARKAAKKGAQCSDRSAIRRAEKALKIESEVVGTEMELLLTHAENEMKKWKSKGVEEENLQRFAARFLAGLKQMNILCAVDTAIFKQEIGHVRLLELEIDSMNSSSVLDRPRMRERANELVSMVIDTEKVPLDQTKEGTAWLLNQNMSTTKNQGSKSNI